MPLSLRGDPHCGSCLQDSPAFDRSLAAVDYSAPLDRLVLALKYAGKLELAHCCAMALAPLLASGEATPDLLCAVPLSAHRLQERGYNQALEIARPLARHLRLRLHARLLERVRETQAQAQLPAPLRRDNVRNAFLLMPGSAAIISGRHVGVVDDVMTTGATLNEIASTLKRFGAARVTNIVFARTPPH